MQTTKVAPQVWSVSVGSLHHHYRIRRFGKKYEAFLMTATTGENIGGGSSLAAAQKLIAAVEGQAK